MTDLGPEVLVVGAGPTGLTLACSLARCGVAVRVVDKALEPSRSARATGYAPRTLEIFDDLGVIDEALRNTWVDLSMRGYRDGEVVQRHSLPTPGTEPGKYEPPYMLRRPTDEIPYPMMARPLPTWRVEEVLRNRLAALGVQVEYGRRLVSLVQDDEGVTAILRVVNEDSIGWGHAFNDVPAGDVRDGAAEVVRARYVVGCDGGHSTTRHLAGIEFVPGQAHDYVGYIAEVQLDGVEPTFSRSYTRSDGAFLHLNPITHAKNFQVQAIAQADEEGTYKELTVELLESIVHDITGDTSIRVYDMTWKSLWRVREALALRYRVGRIFVGGDAAHVHSPMGGQGANTGVGDGYNLGWKLAYVVKGWARPSVLDSYEVERRPVAAQVVRSSGERHKEQLAANRTFTPDRQPRPDFTYWLMSQLGISYADSPLTGGDRLEDEPTAGDRAPDGQVIDARTGERLRLFDLYRGYHFTLLCFGFERAPVAAAVAERYAGMVRPVVVKEVDDRVEGFDGIRVVDPDGFVATSYHAAVRPLVLVRPDGYIACHGREDAGDDLIAHLDTIVSTTLVGAE